MPAKLNRFIYGRAVRPDEFLNREDELRTIFNRLRLGESSAVVGEPHIGKSSLLLKIADETTQQNYLGNNTHRLVTCTLDLLPISSDYVPTTFWEEVLEPLKERPGHAPVARQLQQTDDLGYSRRSFERLFSHLGQQGTRLVLLLDEFERLLSHPNFQQPSFFALLRSLAIRTGGLVVIPASRFSIAEMNERGRRLLETGSPLFNYFIELRLSPFDEETVDALMNLATDPLSLDERRFMSRARLFGNKMSD